MLLLLLVVARRTSADERLLEDACRQRRVHDGHEVVFGVIVLSRREILLQLGEREPSARGRERASDRVAVRTCNRRRHWSV